MLARYSIKLTNEFCQKMKNADVLRIIAMVVERRKHFLRERERERERERQRVKKSFYIRVS